MKSESLTDCNLVREPGQIRLERDLTQVFEDRILLHSSPVSGAGRSRRDIYFDALEGSETLQFQHIIHSNVRNWHLLSEPNAWYGLL